MIRARQPARNNVIAEADKEALEQFVEEFANRKTLTPALSHPMGEGEHTRLFERPNVVVNNRRDQEVRRRGWMFPLPSDGRGSG